MKAKWLLSVAMVVASVGGFAAHGGEKATISPPAGVGKDWWSAAQQSPRFGPSGHWPGETPAESQVPVGGISAAGLDVQLGGTREPTVAINPLDPQNVVMSSLFQSRASVDGGVSWTAPLNNSVPAGYGQDGDPTLAFDSQGQWFYGYQGYHSSGGADEFVSRMDPVTGGRLSGPFKVSVSGTTGAYNDKPSLAVDRFPGSPFVDRLYMVWTEFPASGITRVLESYSTNQGVTWSPPLTLSNVLGAEGFVWPAHVAVAPNGDVYVSYHSQVSFFCNPDGMSGRVYVVRSTDGGMSFPQKTLAFTAGNADITYNVQNCADGVVSGARFWTQGSNQAFVLPDPQIPGSVYVVAADDTDNDHSSGDDSDVYIARSADNGQTWSAPIRVDHGPLGAFQFFPTAAIDDLTGCIAVIWYDNRNGAVNSGGRYLLDVFYTISDDRGLTWSPDVQINDAPFDPDRGAPIRYSGPPATYRIGEYIGVAFLSGDVQTVWTGNLSLNHQIITDSVVGACNVIPPPPPTPIADETNIDKSRFISFSVPSGASPPETALRVKFTSLHNVSPVYPNPTNLPIPFALFQGQSQYVGPPVQYTESLSDPTTFMASKLQCTPYYQNWSTISLLHVTGEAILPSSSYDVENLGASCMGNEATCTDISAPLTIATARFGDVIINGAANFPDIQAEVAKYQSKPGAPIKARSKLATTNTRGLINIGLAVGFADISADVSAYQGKPYPYNPGKCTGAPATACKDDTECVGTGPCILCP
jgi:hypothetical protein